MDLLEVHFHKEDVNTADQVFMSVLLDAITAKPTGNHVSSPVFLLSKQMLSIVRFAIKVPSEITGMTSSKQQCTVLGASQCRLSIDTSDIFYKQYS